MKRFLQFAGIVFIVLALAIGGFVGYAAYRGRDLDTSSKAYVEANVPPILSAWSKDELLKRSSPELLKIIATGGDDIDRLFSKLSQLGAMKTFGDVKGESFVSYTTQSGKAVTAAYTAKAVFEKGEAHVSVRLVQSSGQWKFLAFYVNSPLFLR